MTPGSAEPTMDMYIYNMPYTEKRKLCACLDLDRDIIKELAYVHMGFDDIEVQGFLQTSSPTESLLHKWGHQNHSVLAFYMLLYKIKHFRAMTILKHLVPEEYRHLCTVVPELPPLLTKENKILNCLPNQVQTPSPQRPPAPRGGTQVTRDDNITPIQAQQRFIAIPMTTNEARGRLVVPTTPPPPLVPGSPRTGVNIQLPGRCAPFNDNMLGQGTSRAMTSDISCVTEVAGSITHIAYEELKTATNNWDESTILGRGGFGIVFKGTWRNTTFAIKRIALKDNSPNARVEQIRQPFTELKCLNAFRHDNILPLYGYSSDGPEPCLLYKYMAGGNLEQRLRSSVLFLWATRLNIAIETARGLQYLHTCSDVPLVHGDIKPANILLDENEKPKIGDFGLAREGPTSLYTHIQVTSVHGTRFYLPDEFLRSRNLSIKVDTFSFGLVLLELATNLRVYDKRRADPLLKDHVMGMKDDLIRIKDSRVPGGDDLFRGLIEIGKVCVNDKPRLRWEMVKVLEKLEDVKKEFVRQ